MKQRVMLYFGSFNPIHKGHVALAEYAIEQDLCDEVVLIVSPQSPYKRPDDLAPEMDRFEMAEAASAASRYPGQIKASPIEFILPRPSYTIDTLRFLEGECGERMEFSILMGGDQIAAIEGWKEFEKVLAYPVYVYPRPGERIDRYLDRITLLEGAPLFDISATEIRTRAMHGEEISAFVAPAVADYIRKKGLWTSAQRLEQLDAAIAAGNDDPVLHLERGTIYYRMNRWGDALNDFNKVLATDPDCTEAQQYLEMVEEILAFRYKDIYNP